MAQTVVVKVTVEELSKYGFKSNGKYVGLSKQLSDADRARIVPGAQFEAEYYVADSGKEYLNRILNVENMTKAKQMLEEAGTDVKLETKMSSKKKFTPSFEKKTADTEKMTKADWTAKDRSQMIGGRSHDAAQLALAAVTVGMSAEDVMKMYTQILSWLLVIAEEVK